ncbi:Endothelin-converting enzyme 1 [Cyphellophora attinorum]|uniref:Endothelin-converting enzyme 1 n=1 Tax=Cyphellophora attinorum TaxID=1664694 RepID=A0A0N1H2I4_9EURO|nr:Endothelin-converting enzyme 1 [Phialophora attinorum]KPI34534.1 Endothelin-converting enzyme 1 [Phialophora attinorum]
MEKEKEQLLVGEEVATRPQPRAVRRRAAIWALGATALLMLFLHGTIKRAALGCFQHRKINGGILSSQGLMEAESAEVCTTPACVHAASELLYNLSPEYKDLDACTNFEELVCGGWKERHDLRPDQGDAFTGTIMSENSQLLLRHILEASYPKDSSHSEFSPVRLLATEASADEDNFKKLQDGYNACLDEATIKEAGTKPLEEILSKIRELYKVDEPCPSGEDIAKTVLYLSELGVTALVTAGTGADDKDPDKVVVSVSAPWRIGLPSKERYEDDDLLNGYEGTIGRIFQHMHLTNQPIPRKVIQLEQKLAAACPDQEDMFDVTNQLPKDTSADNVINMTPDYLKKLAGILEETDRDVLLGYFYWKTIQAYGPYIEADVLKPLKEWNNFLAGKDKDAEEDRWRTCVDHVDGGLGWILSRFFIEKAFSEKAKNFGDQIVSDIKTEFIEKLKKTEWMEKEVQDLGIDKVHNIVQKIGYPTKSPDIMNPTKLAKYYSDVSVSPKTFFANAVTMARSEITKSWAAYGKPVDRNEWGMTVPTVNAYYNPPGNEIVFPAGIMQFPVFDVNVPEYLSYGAFGSVSGHELSHAFDSTGRHYDQTGNYTDWWTEHTVREFEKRADCFVEQYHNYTIDGPDGKPLHVNGKLTLGENIADAGGVSAAFSAWKKRAAEKKNQNLPGLEHFTQEQLFFVNYANWWCGASRKETAVNRIYTDPHAPKWARVLGTMANSREFKEAFSCKVKEPVCELW